MKTHLPSKSSGFLKDFDAQDIVYRNFLIAVQNCVDIGSHIISVKRWQLPSKMGEVFELLAHHRLISERLARKLINMVILRNIIVHNYTRIDVKKAYSLVKSSIKLIPKFCLSILKTKAPS